MTTHSDPPITALYIEPADWDRLEAIQQEVRDMVRKNLSAIWTFTDAASLLLDGCPLIQKPSKVLDNGA